MRQLTSCLKHPVSNIRRRIENIYCISYSQLNINKPVKRKKNEIKKKNKSSSIPRKMVFNHAKVYQYTKFIFNKGVPISVF